MILLQLRANFGKLHGTLTLHEGLNELCLPNEAGKSTWSAFLLAMLYGIDTRERATRENQNLPAKERYRPWDGSSMEGAIDLIWNGRAITIERRSQGRTPMGAFRAYETESGTPVPELTAENCGRTLCGAERSVFERTAFVRQLGMAVSSDAQLEQRLSALVTTGEEGPSASALEKKLRDLKNKYTYRTGLLPRLQARRDELQAQLSALRAAQAEGHGAERRLRRGRGRAQPPAGPSRPYRAGAGCPPPRRSDGAAGARNGTCRPLRRAGGADCGASG